MNVNKALKIRKMIPKNRIKKVELVFFYFAETCVMYEKERLSEDKTQSRLNEIIKGTISQGLVTVNNMKDFIEISERPYSTYVHLKGKYNL